MPCVRVPASASLPPSTPSQRQSTGKPNSPFGPCPSEILRSVAGRVAFYNELVDITVDGVRQERPESPFSSREQRPGGDA